MLIYAHSGPLQPLLCRQRATSRVARSPVSLCKPRHRLYGPAQPYGAQSVLIVRANDEGDKPQGEPEEPRKAHAGAVAARQLLSVTALAFFTLLATVVKGRATSPIIPPLIPTLLDATSNNGGLSSKPQPATATAEVPTAEASSSSKAAVKPSRSLLRALWGTATAPVKLVDSLLFPEEALVGSKTKQDSSADSATAAQPAPAAANQPKQGRKAAASAAEHGTLSRAVPAADPAAAAASQALTSLSQQVDALVAAFSEVPPSSPAGSIAPDFLVQLQEAVARMVSQQKGSAQGAGQIADITDTSTAAATDADAAAVLAVLRMMIGPDAMSLLPVLLVTSATAAAGLMMAASIAAVAGLVDKRRALTPAQRAAQAALLESPLRPITCQTWPGFLPMLPSSIEPNYYRFRDSDTPAAAAAAASAGSSSASSSSNVSGAAAAASAAGSGPKEHPLDQEWWSFAQIQALRLMPLLPSSSSNGSSNGSSSGSKASSSVRSSSSSAAPVAAAAAGAAAAATTAAATAGAAAATAKAQPAGAPARSFAEVKADLCRHANVRLCHKKGDKWNNLLFGVMRDDSDAALLLGEPWQLAVSLAAVDTLASPDEAWEVVHSFGATAPTGILAEVCALIPAAVVAVRDATSGYDADWDSGSMTGWEQSSLLICMLLDPATNGLGRVQEVCESMGIVGTAAAPDTLQGALQQHCQRLVRETVEFEAISDLTFGTAVPEAQRWLEAGKRQRVGFATAALNSSIMAAYTVAELWGEAVGETMAGLAVPDAAPGVSWQEPRTLLQHTRLLHHVLHKVLPDNAALAPLAADILDLSTPALHEQAVGLGHLLDYQEGPPNGFMHQAHLHEVMAAAAMHKRIHAAAAAPASFDAALRPVFDGCAGLVEADAPLFEDGEIEFRVIDTLVASALVVKLPQTALPFTLRPEWPAAQTLALIDTMLLPSQSKYLLDNFAPEDNSVDGSISEFVARTLVLLPAAVVNVRSFLDQKAAGDTQHVHVRRSLRISRESASAVCLRMYERVLTGICEARASDSYVLSDVVSALGLSPAAVAAAADNVTFDGKRIDAAADAAIAAATAAGQHVAEEASLGTGSLLTEVSGNYAFTEAEHDRAFNRSVMTSFAVCLPLLLQLYTDHEWPLPSWDNSHTNAEQCQDVQPSGDWAALPPRFWGFAARCFSESGAAQLPGGAAAAALLRASLTQAQEWAQKHHTDKQYSECEPLTQEHYTLACARLCASSSRSSSTSSSSQTGEGPAPWEAAMAAALVLPVGLDLDGDEQWRERQDYKCAIREGNLWWLEDSTSDSSEGEEGEQDSDDAAEVSGSRDGDGEVSGDWDADEQQEEEAEVEAEYAGRDWEEEGYESDQKGEMDAGVDEPDFAARTVANIFLSRGNVPHASAHASCDSVSDGEEGAAPTATEAEACEQFYEMLFDVIVGAPDEIEVAVQQLEEAGAGLGKAWGLAVYAAYALHQECAVGKGTPVEGTVECALRQFASAAPARLVAEVVALLPAAVMNYKAARLAAAAGAGVSTGKNAAGDSGSSGSETWESAAYLVNALLTPTNDAAAAASDDPASWVRRICWELGLYWHGKYESKDQLHGVLQKWAEEVSASDDELSSLHEMQWGSAAASQALRARAEANQEVACQLANMGLRSTFMAAYMAMEVWYSQDSPFMPADLGAEKSRACANAAAPDAKYPDVLFSHYAMLQCLADGSRFKLWKLVSEASTYAATPYYRNQGAQRFIDDADEQIREPWGESNKEEDKSYRQMLDEPLTLVIRNSGGPGHTQLLGRLPDVFEFGAVSQCLQKVQGDMHSLLCLPQQTLEEAEQLPAASELVSALAEAVICGEELVPVKAKASVHGLLAAMPEWYATAQLVELEARCSTYVSEDAAEQLLQRFAAEVDDRVLARVCALLPAVVYLNSTDRRPCYGAKNRFELDAAWTVVLDELTARVKDAAAAGELVRHMGLQPAAAAAAAAAVGGRNFGHNSERVDAAIAAMADSSMPVECPGFLQEVWHLRSKFEADSAEAKAATAVARSVLTAAAELLKSMATLPPAADAQEPAVAVAADSAQQSKALLPLEGWQRLVQDFSALPHISITGKAAAAGLLYHGLLAAQAREGPQQQPAAFLAVLKHALHKWAEGPVTDPEDTAAAKLLDIHKSTGWAHLEAFVPEHPVSLARRPGSEGAAAAEAATAAAQAASRQPGSPAASAAAAAAESSIDSDAAEQQSAQQHSEQVLNALAQRNRKSYANILSDADLVMSMTASMRTAALGEYKRWVGRSAADSDDNDDGMLVGEYKPVVKSPDFNAASSSSSDSWPGADVRESTASSSDSSSGPSVADVREFGWSEGWGVPGEGEVDAGDGSGGKQKGKKKERKQNKNKNKQNRSPQQQQREEDEGWVERKYQLMLQRQEEERRLGLQQQKEEMSEEEHLEMMRQQQQQEEEERAWEAERASVSHSTVKGAQQQQKKEGKGKSSVPETSGTSSSAGQPAGAVKVTVEEGAAPAATLAGQPAGAVKVTVEEGDITAAAQAGQAADQDKEGGGGSKSELIPTVKTLLGLPVDPADSLSTGDVVPNRLALLMCQAMLMRGDDAQAKLQAAVGYLAVAKSGQALQLPAMLSNCMEALFTTEDWESPTGSARQVLSSLSDALPWQSYMSLQKHLMAKGLIRELEVPAEFE